MRTIVDLPKDDIQELDRLGKRKKLSRAALVRQAVRKLIEEEKATSGVDIMQFFGYGKGRSFQGMDGLDFQNMLRAESDRDLWKK